MVQDYKYQTTENIKLMEMLEKNPEKYIVWVDNDLVTVSEKLSKEVLELLTDKQIQVLQDHMDTNGNYIDFDIFGQDLIIFLFNYIGIDARYV